MVKQHLKLFLICITGVIVSILFLVYTIPYIIKDSPQYTESIFVYGTLQNELIRFYACRCFVIDTPITLYEFKKIGLNIVPSSASAVDGNIIRVTPQQLQYIDAYENVPDKYIRSTITIGSMEYFVYIKNE